MPRFSRAELESFRDAEVPDLLGPGLRLLFVGINPGLWTAATSTHFAHPVNRFYPALLEAGIIDRRIDPAAGMTEEDRDYLRASGHRHHQPGPPGHRPGRRAHPRGAARRCHRPRRAGRAALPPRRRRRRDHRLPAGVRPAARRRRASSRIRWREPGSGSCRTRAGSTPTTRSPRWPRRTPSRHGPRGCSAEARRARLIPTTAPRRSTRRHPRRRRRPRPRRPPCGRRSARPGPGPDRAARRHR